MALSESQARVAIVHDYLTQYGGAERVLEELCTLWPHADLYTTFYDHERMARLGFRVPRRPRPLLPPWLPHHGGWAKPWTPVYPLVWRAFDARRYEVVISSTSFAAHQVRVAPGAIHVSYCHSPPRFLHGLTTELDHERIHRLFPLARPLYAAMRKLDQTAAARVTQYVANSGEVRARIERIYGRPAEVVYPPVDTARFAAAVPRPGEYFLTWGRLVGSKRVDLLIRATALARVPLVIAGSGPEEPRLRALAGPQASFLGRVSDSRRLALLERCRAVLFAAEEDFGMVPVEAMAAGKPVIAYGVGGALETVVAGETGEFFYRQTPEALAELLARWGGARYDPARCRARAAAFDVAVFRRRMREVVENCRDAAIARRPSIG